MMYQGRRTEKINSQSSQCITGAGHCGLALYSQMMGERFSLVPSSLLGFTDIYANKTFGYD